MRGIIGVAVLLVSATAVANPDFDHLVFGGGGEDPGPRFAFTDKLTFDAAKTVADARSGLGTEEWVAALAVNSTAGPDKATHWVAADLIPFEIGCGAAPCPPEPPPGPAEWHATALFDGERVVVWHIARVVDAKAQKVALEKGTVPPAIKKKIDGAEELVKVFEASIGDPKALAATVSDRKDVVLYGNEAKERTVGGAKVKAKLLAWKLGFAVRDGIQAGLTSSKAIGWVVANVDAKSAKKPKDKPVPYRLLFLYEKKGTAWKLVSANFSFVD